MSHQRRRPAFDVSKKNQAQFPPAHRRSRPDVSSRPRSTNDRATRFGTISGSPGATSGASPSSLVQTSSDSWAALRHALSIFARLSAGGAIPRTTESRRAYIASRRPIARLKAAWAIAGSAEQSARKSSDSRDVRRPAFSPQSASAAGPASQSRGAPFRPVTVLTKSSAGWPPMKSASRNSCSSLTGKMCFTG